MFLNWLKQGVKRTPFLKKKSSKKRRSAGVKFREMRSLWFEIRWL